jgi:hypothetical protein
MNVLAWLTPSRRRQQFLETYPWPLGLHAKFTVHYPELSTYQ